MTSGSGHTVSVVLAAYNGSKYIVDQLESIRLQNKVPDEVIILDDCSTDSTAERCERYISGHDVKGWRVVRNKTNVGYVSNFLSGIGLAKGDYIFFSDQDDIWLPEKIARMVRVFEDHEDALVVACDVDIIDSEGSVKRTLQTDLRKTRMPVKKIAFDEQVSSLLSSGLTLGVEANFAREMAPLIEENGLSFDSPFGLFASARSGFYRVGCSLVLHRVHDSNASNPHYSIRDRFRDRESHIRGREYQLSLLEACEKCCSSSLDALTRGQLAREIGKRRESVEALRSGKSLFFIGRLLSRDKMMNRKVEIANLMFSLKRKDR